MVGWAEPGGSSAPCGVSWCDRHWEARMSKVVCSHGGSWCWLSAEGWTGQTQLSSTWPVHLLRLLTVWKLGSKWEHSKHLEAEAVALLRHSLWRSTVRTSTTFYWSKPKLAQVKRRRGKEFVPSFIHHTQHLIKGLSIAKLFFVTFSKYLACKCQNAIFWLFLFLAMKWGHR